ncbi:alpha/beta fold hydrolase [Croceicoccus naphthovorans]|uniref:Lysophospholipase n=1 Tax=Croceicoccus naphthovorans TaxID=1348774 RepID=A0A0G3XGX9_9SPHN|nr:alpha/beta hydrolase [Croceicoccus naphthovorans]AKM10790.1 lysophospholipase [Croceicoccus naphthovorans]MBB3988996.1 lysophospholipase [Croceicoccus naphthovorans]
MSQSAAQFRRAIPPVATEATWHAADGHAVRRIDWPGAAAESGVRGAILFLAGRGDHYEKYLETLHGWHLKGWAVTALDWRGQAGSGRLGTDATTGHVDNFAHWIDDLDAFWPQWRAAHRGPHVAIGHSMGGHLTLRALEEKRIDPVAAVLVAPMLGFSGIQLPYWLMRGFARWRAGMGDPRRPAWKWSERPGEFPAGRKALLTHDAERYADEGWWRQARPELVMGPGSWGWLEQAVVSMQRVMQTGALAGMEVPTLLLSTKADRLVSPAAIRRAAKLLPKAELLEFGREAAHEILREADPVRERALAAIDRFLAEKAPAW